MSDYDISDDSSDSISVDYYDYDFDITNENRYEDTTDESSDGMTDSDNSEHTIIDNMDDSDIIIVEHMENSDNGSGSDTEIEEAIQQNHERLDVKTDLSLLENKPPNSQFNDNCCTICMELWTNSSDHRLVSLRCGHLFGKSCIEHWIQVGKKRCPQCNALTKKSDVRVIFARNLRTLDTSERDRAIEDLEKERKLRINAENMYQQSQFNLNVKEKENERLRRELMESHLKIQSLMANTKNTDFVTSDNSSKLEPFELIKDVEISGCGGCRLLAYSSLFQALAVSLPISSGIWRNTPGFGVKKVLIDDFRSSDVIYIHSKCIKDIVFNNYEGTLLSASLDKTIKLTSLINKSLISSCNLDVEAWSVAFNPKNIHEFFAGLRNGQILLFDTRKMSSPVDQLESSSKSPVVSLQYIDYDSKNTNISGLLATQLDTVSLYQRIKTSDNVLSSDFRIRNIPCDGRFSSSHFEVRSGHALLSCRPSTKHKNITHYVMDLSNANIEERSMNSSIVQYFSGGTEQIQISRSRIFPHPFNENSTIVCAGDESSKGAYIWDVNSKSCVQKIKSDIPILDLSLIHRSNTNNFFLTALNEKFLKVYKCVS